eukprot:jgi/Ulvmu1/3976/UM182_0004.1
MRAPRLNVSGAPMAMARLPNSQILHSSINGSTSPLPLAYYLQRRDRAWVSSVMFVTFVLLSANSSRCVPLDNICQGHLLQLQYGPHLASSGQATAASGDDTQLMMV